MSQITEVKGMIRKLSVAEQTEMEKKGLNQILAVSPDGNRRIRARLLPQEEIFFIFETANNINDFQSMLMLRLKGEEKLIGLNYIGAPQGRILYSIQWSTDNNGYQRSSGQMGNPMTLKNDPYFQFLADNGFLKITEKDRLPFKIDVAQAVDSWLNVVKECQADPQKLSHLVFDIHNTVGQFKVPVIEGLQT